MQTQGIRIFLYSSLAIVALAFIWGARQIPQQNQARAAATRESLDHELTVVRSAVKASTDALTYRLLDVLKSENHSLEDTPFASATLLQWEQVEWKSVWYQAKSKTELQSTDLKKWMKDWPLNKIAPGDVYFAKVADVQGVAYFALLTQVVKPGQAPMIGVGIFAAAQFGLSLPSEDTREIRVFNDKSFALALGHPAYLGAALKRDPLVEEILTGEQMRILREWKNEGGGLSEGTAARLGESNLFVSVEVTNEKTPAYFAYIYLVVTALGALLLNWVLFKSLLQPLLNQLTEAELEAEALRRRAEARPSEPTYSVLPTPGLPATVTEDAPPPFFQAKLSDHDFVEVPHVAKHVDVPPEAKIEPEPVPRTSLAKVIQLCLRTFQKRFSDMGVKVQKSGFEGIEVDVDALQLQTALEEILKNALDAMAESETRELTITGEVRGGLVTLKFADTGKGVAPEHLAQVFDPFFTTKKGDGPARGLGLNVVRRVVEDLHGQTRLMSGKTGATLVMEWPENFTENAKVTTPLRHEISEDDIDLEDEFTFTPTRTNWPDVAIRKPVVRNLD